MNSYMAVIHNSRTVMDISRAVPDSFRGAVLVLNLRIILLF